MSMIKAEKTLQHLNEGIDIMGIMTADVTLQIPKLLDKTTKFVQDFMLRELEDTSQHSIQTAKRGRRKVHQCSDKEVISFRKEKESKRIYQCQ